MIRHLSTCRTVNVKILHAHFFLIPVLCVSSEPEANVSPAQTDLEQDEDGSGDEDSGCDNSLDQGGIMDFSTTAIAEQLTRMDSVRDIFYVPHFHICIV